MPNGALVCMRTGWGRKFTDQKAYMNFEEAEFHPLYSGGTMHFPGFSKESAEFLCRERNICAIGIDTLSLDKGSATSFDVHMIILGNNKYQIENMYLEDAPAHGGTFISLPLKVRNAPEMSTRVIAFTN